MRKSMWAVLGVALALTMGSAQALPIVVDGTIETLFDGAGAYMGGSIDCLAFDVTAGTTVVFDGLADEIWGIDLNGDGILTYLDLMFVLQDSGGYRLTEADDSYVWEGTGDGSMSTYDSYLEYTFAAAGTYRLFVGNYYIDDLEIANDYNFMNGSQGAYRVTITVQNGSFENLRVNGQPDGNDVVPEPATLTLLGLGVSGYALRRLRRSR